MSGGGNSKRGKCEVVAEKERGERGGLGMGKGFAPNNSRGESRGKRKARQERVKSNQRDSP